MNKEEYTLSTFRKNWKEHGFLEALRIDNRVTESRYEAPTIRDIHALGKEMAYEVGGFYTSRIEDPEAILPEQAAYLLCALVGYPLGYVGGLMFGALGVKAKSLETEAKK